MLLLGANSPLIRTFIAELRFFANKAVKSMRVFLPCKK